LTQLGISHLLGFIPPSQFDIPKLLEYRPRSHLNVPPPTFPLTSSFRPLVRLLLLNAEDTQCMAYRLHVLFLRKNLSTSDLSSKSATLFHFPHCNHVTKPMFASHPSLKLLDLLGHQYPPHAKHSIDLSPRLRSGSVKKEGQSPRAKRRHRPILNHQANTQCKMPHPFINVFKDETQRIITVSISQTFC